MSADLEVTPAATGEQSGVGLSSSHVPAGRAGGGDIPYRGMRETVPPAYVPLSLLLASGFGLVVFGIALFAVAPRISSEPTSLAVVGAVHFGMVAFLSTAVLGALHQFAPVLSRVPLRSVRNARATVVVWIAGAWILPAGFAVNAVPLFVTGGLLVVTAAFAAAWNLSHPLLQRSRGEPLVGLRSSIAFLLMTVCFGIVYAFDVHHGWFGLRPTLILTHVQLGLVGWIGLSYVSVAEKLWPMFLLSHKDKAGAGWIAIRVLPAGVVLTATGLLLANKWVAVLGAVLSAAGAVAHGVSFFGWMRGRRRKLELLHAFVIVSLCFLAITLALGAIAGLADVSISARTRFVTAYVAGLTLWSATAIVGHAHKIVPFITWTTLRARGISRRPDGKPILFGDLYNAGVARLSFGTVLLAGLLLLPGLITGNAGLVRTGAILLSLCGAVTTANLSLWPRRIRKDESDNAITPTSETVSE